MRLDAGGAGRPAAGAQPGPKRPGLRHLPRERDPLFARLCIPEPLGLMDGFGEFPANPHGIILLHAVAVGGMGLNRDPPRASPCECLDQVSRSLPSFYLSLCHQREGRKGSSGDGDWDGDLTGC